VKIAKLLLLISCCALSGCSLVELFQAEQPPYNEELPNPYIQTRLEESTSAYVLAIIHRPDYEQLSQSKSVIASSGQKKKGYQRWFNMVAFDENELTAKRKYFFVVDEKGKVLLGGPKRSLLFETEMVLDRKLLDKPYANENARRIDILRQVTENTRRDIDELAQDNKTLATSGMLINQTLKTVLQKLDDSPVLASKLTGPNGLEFDHLTLGKGVAFMNLEKDIIKTKIEVGSLVWTSQDPFALEE
jgi:hypothetical protein